MSTPVSPSPTESSVSTQNTPSIYSINSNFSKIDEEAQRVKLQENRPLLELGVTYTLYSINTPRPYQYTQFALIADSESMDGPLLRTTKNVASYALPLIGLGLLAYGIAYEHKINDPEDKSGIYCIQTGVSLLCIYTIFQLGKILYLHCYKQQ